MTVIGTAGFEDSAMNYLWESAARGLPEGYGIIEEVG
jgi:hypothetical protein